MKSLITAVLVIVISFLDKAYAIKDCLNVKVEKCSFTNMKGETIDCFDWTTSDPCDVSITLEYSAKNKLYGDEPSTVIIFDTRNIDRKISKIELKQGEVFNFTLDDIYVNLCHNPVYAVTIFAKAVNRDSVDDINLQELCEIVYNDYNLPAASGNMSQTESHDYYEFKCIMGRSKRVKQSLHALEMETTERTQLYTSSFSFSVNSSADFTSGTLEPSMQAFPSSEPSFNYNSSSLPLMNTSAPSAVPSILSDTSKSSKVPSRSMPPSQSTIPSYHLNNISIAPFENETIVEENTCIACMELMKNDIKIGRGASNISLYFSLVLFSERNVTDFLLEKALIEVLNGIFKAEFLGCNENEASRILPNHTSLVLADFQDMDINTMNPTECSFLERDFTESECRSAIGKVQVHYVGVNTEIEISYQMLQLLDHYSDWIRSYIEEVNGLYFVAITGSKDSLLAGNSTRSQRHTWVIPTFMLSFILLIVAGLFVLHCKGKKLWMKIQDDSNRFSDRLYPNSFPIPIQIMKKEHPEDLFSDITDEEND